VAICLLMFAVEGMLMIDLERRLALAALLAQPDPPELRRGNRLRLPGKPERFQLVPQLSAVFVQSKLLALYERRAELKEAHTVSNVALQTSQRIPLKIVRQAA
jgi:hypothetical protein